MRKFIYSLIAIAVLLGGCPQCPHVPEPTLEGGVHSDVWKDSPEDAPESAIEVTDAPIEGKPLNKTCVAACAILASLKCPEAETPDGGDTCLDICTKAEASGRFSLKPECVAKAKDLAGVKACGSVRCKR